MWWHADLPALPAGLPAPIEAPPGAVPGEELLLLIDLRANGLMDVPFRLLEGRPKDLAPPSPFRLPSPRKSD